jgi:hypothetical protein
MSLDLFLWIALGVVLVGSILAVYRTYQWGVSTQAIVWIFGSVALASFLGFLWAKTASTIVLAVCTLAVTLSAIVVTRLSRRDCTRPERWPGDRGMMDARLQPPAAEDGTDAFARLARA